jgi:hypothetical protein
MTKNKLNLLIYSCLVWMLTLVVIVFFAHIASMVIIYFKLGVFSVNLSWGKLFIYLKIILMGIPLGIVLWFLTYRKV